MRSHSMMTIGALAFSAALAACSPSGSQDAGAGKYAGLDQAILDWHAEIEKADRLCASKVEGQGCQAFEVTCKVEGVLNAADAKRGATAKAVAAMSWQRFDPKHGEFMPAGEASEFRRIGGKWVRQTVSGINTTTCAPG